MNVVKAATPCLRVCATCPWLRANQGKKHKQSWYALANLRRLWAGLRSGKAPGMVCHASDPDSVHYGGDTQIKAGIRRECAGALVMVIRHVNYAGAMETPAYRKKFPLGLTRAGLAHWIGRHLFGQLPAVEDRSAEIGVPWEDT